MALKFFSLVAAAVLAGAATMIIVIAAALRDKSHFLWKKK